MASISLNRIRGWAETLFNQGVALNEGQCEKLVRLDHMVVTWNRAAGLTGFQDEEERLDRYFGEALHASVFLPKQGRVVDVGSGGGTPALPMAVHQPGLEWTLLEPNYKKTVFLQEACAKLELDPIEVVQSRFQEFKASGLAAVTVRGLALDDESLNIFRQWLRPSGRLLILTGDKAGQRIVEGEMRGWNAQTRQLLAPRFQAVLVVLRKNGPSE